MQKRKFLGTVFGMSLVGMSSLVQAQALYGLGGSKWQNETSQALIKEYNRNQNELERAYQSTLELERRLRQPHQPQGNPPPTGSAHHTTSRLNLLDLPSGK